MAQLLWLRPGFCILPAAVDTLPCEAFHVVCEDASVLPGLPPAPASARRITASVGPAALFDAALAAVCASHPSVVLHRVAAASAADIPAAIARHVTARHAAVGVASVTTCLAVHDAVRTMDNAVSAALASVGAVLHLTSASCLSTPLSDPAAIRVAIDSIPVDAGGRSDAVEVTLPVWNATADVDVRGCSTAIVDAAITHAAVTVHANVRAAAEIIVSATLSMLQARSNALESCKADSDTAAAAPATSDIIPADARTVLTDASSVSTESRGAAAAPTSQRPRSSAYVAMMTAPPHIQSAVSMGLMHSRTAAAACSLLKRHAVVHDAVSSLGVVPRQAHTTLLEYASCIQDWLVRREVAHAVVAASPALCEYSGTAALSGALPWTTVPSGRGSVHSPSVGATPRKAETSSWLSILSVSSSTPSAAATEAQPVAHAAFPPMPWPAMAAALALDAPPAAGVPPDAADRFWSGRTGFPLVDATMACLHSHGYAPPPLYALLHVFWCKYTLRPWSEGVRGLLRFLAAPDAAMQVLAWQWNAGLASDCTWAIPMDAADTAHGWLREDMEAVAGCDAFDGGWYLWARLCPALPPHAHAMAHPSGVEFARGPDPYGAFVRAMLPLPPCLPDAFVYTPSAASPALQTALHLRMDTRGGVAAAAATQLPVDVSAWARLAGARARSSPTLATPPASPVWQYPAPLVPLTRARETVLELVMGLMRTIAPPPAAATHAPPMPHPSGGSARPLLRGLPAPHPQLQRYIRGRAAAGFDPVWGTVASWPLLVEEDATLLLSQAHAGVEDGWMEIVDDAERRLRVYMQSRTDTPVKTVLATAVMPRHVSGSVFEAITVLKKYVTWDRTWQHVSTVGEPLDAYNEPMYYIADAPPPPYSYIITQRDFVMFRHVARDVHTGLDVVVHRNAAHASSVTTAKFIRGEALGVVGFTVQPCTRPAGVSEATQPNGIVLVCTGAGSTASGAAAGTYDVAGGTQVVLVTAADPKGAIPSYLVNFVAKRTPRIWVDRLTEACDRFDRATEQ